MKRTLILAISLALTGGYAMAQTNSGQMTTAEVMQAVERAGYTDIRDVEFDDGLWDVEATATDGRRVDLHVDPRSGEIIDPNVAPTLTAADIASRLQAQGYSNVRDIEYDDGRYEVEATNSAGQNVDLKINPRDGSILREEND
jgi:uncharacterized membrane protein YkoI